MISKYYGKNISIDSILEQSFLGKHGMSILEIADAGEAIGLRSSLALVNLNALKEDVELPAILHWKRSHFVILYKIDRNGFFWIADPDFGLLKVREIEFLANWTGEKYEESKEEPILFFSITPFFNQQKEEDEEIWLLKMLGIFKHYLLPHKRYVYQVFLSLLGGSVLLFALPFLTQSIIDIGIVNQNISFIRLVLVAQLLLFSGRIVGDILRNRILLFVGLRINISMASDFLLKLTKLPISYFESRQPGDFFQRIVDHDRIEVFLTKSIVNALFSILNLIVFLLILLWFSLRVFAIFILGSILYFAWISIFSKKRKRIDQSRFEASSKNHDQLITLIHGMQEIKMNNAEKENRWKWEKIQARLFKISERRLLIDQSQQIGSAFINEAKNILITFFSALSVISGELTLGQMLAIQFIIGQLNGPLLELIDFIKSAQDANISLERINDISALDDEEIDSSMKIESLSEDCTLNVNNVDFRYGGPRSDLVLKNITTTIEAGKVTAIIGTSGSGKTTLMKLLLKFYQPTNGHISVGNNNLGNYGFRFWRETCAAVMQDGYIFSDTIRRNIVVQGVSINEERMINSCKIAHIYDFINGLPKGFNTMIGANGVGLSGGQKQRILIARAVYKDPSFIFFDEATSSLDSENEKNIMESLNTFFAGRTVVIIAHRLSTVKNADKIIVLNNGEIVEEGSHNELIAKNSFYFSLVRNQLELGK